MKKNLTKTEDRLKTDAAKKKKKALEGKEIREVTHLRELTVNTKHIDLAMVLSSLQIWKSWQIQILSFYPSLQE